MNGHHLSRASTAGFSQQSTITPGRTPPTGRALEQAIGRFRARLDGSQLNDFRITTYQSLCDQILQIQKKPEAAKSTMNLARIRAFLEAMDQFGKVIEVFLNASNMVAFVWGPMKFLFMVCTLHILVTCLNILARLPVPGAILSNCCWRHMKT
jgi:hypothetical protein